MVRLRLGPSASVGAGGCLARIVPTVISLAFIGLGSWFSFLLGRSLLASLAVRGWEASECEVVTSAVEERPGDPATEEFVFTVAYRYRAGGEDWVAGRVRPGYLGSEDPRPAQLLLESYPAGARVACWVDPEDPSAATLERPGLLTGLWILFPLTFVAIGMVVLLAAWWPGRRGGGEPAAPDAAGAPPLSRRAPSAAVGAGCLTAFFGVFLLAGAAVLWFVSGRPASRAWAAREWRETPCVVERSSVREHPGDDGSTYSVEVLYAYTVDGREYKSSRYDFLPGSSSGYEGKAAVVERLPAGLRTVCWVDPGDPTSAVLERRMHKGYLFGLFGLPFFLAGAGGIAFTLRGWRRAGRQDASGAPAWLPSRRVDPTSSPFVGPGAAASGPVILRPGSTPLGKLLGLTFAALFWNGITGVFLWQVVAGWKAGAGDGCLTVFLIPFVLIGLALLASVPYQILALFNPRPLLTLERGEIVPGEALQLSWRFRGLAGRIRKLEISLEGREEATYRRGTSSTTDKQIFAKIALVEATQPLEIAAGTTRVALPAGTMHTFVASHNKVLWTLKVAGQIARWPDVGEEFELVVRPPEVER
jgi:hypothetical protein